MLATPAISIVDDDQAVRSALSSLLRSLGLIAFVFSSPLEFLASAELRSTALPVLSRTQMVAIDDIAPIREVASCHCLHQPREGRAISGDA